MKSFNMSIEDEVANAFIESKQRKLKYTEIFKYAHAVMNTALKNNIRINELLIDRDVVDSFMQMYNDLYTDNEDEIALKENVTIDALIDRFRGYIPLDMLMCFVDKEAISIFNKQGV